MNAPNKTYSTRLNIPTIILYEYLYFFFQIQLEAGERVVPVIQTGVPAIKPAESPIRTEPKPAHETHIKIEHEGK